MNVAAYSKPVSALQSGNRFILEGFSRRRRSQFRGASSYAVFVRASRSGDTWDRMTTHDETGEPERRSISIFGREFAMPRSRALRIAIGVALCLGGVVGFLPVLGFWMIPLGLLVLSYEFAVVRRWRRRFVVWWERWWRARRGGVR